ncbi:TfoX/Sxy family protein [Nostoc sp. NIES-2111]
MAYDLSLAERIRRRLEVLPTRLEEKQMMGGLCFMVDGKMCVGILKDELMCRIDPALHDETVERPGCRTMDFTKRPMSGFVLVEPATLQSAQEFEYYIALALAFNPRAKATKKR